MNDEEGRGREGRREMSGEWKRVTEGNLSINADRLAPFISSRSKDFPVLLYNKNVPHGLIQRDLR